MNALGFDITAHVKDLFFDSLAVRAAIGKGLARALSTIGAFVRTKARTRILRRRKTVSSAGSPPSIHSDEPGLQTILFIYDPAEQTVIIGPRKLHMQSGAGADKPIPALLEFGGVATIEEQSGDGGRTWRRRDLRYNLRPGRLYRRRRATYGPRPFMGPALEAALPELPQHCRDLIAGPAAAYVARAA